MIKPELDLKEFEKSELDKTEHDKTETDYLRLGQVRAWIPGSTLTRHIDRLSWLANLTYQYGGVSNSDFSSSGLIKF